MRLTNFDMDALRSFAVGMEAGSFARAADRLGRSTSAVRANDPASIPATKLRRASMSKLVRRITTILNIRTIHPE